MTSEVDIDDSLYSRQRYVLGDGAMQRMAKASVLLYGLGGIGIEIAKDIVLAGIKSLTVQDAKVATTEDLGTQFFLREEDVKEKKNRAEASAGRLSELNPYVSLSTLTYPLDESTDLAYLSQFQCVIVTELPLSLQLKVNNFCRSNDIKYISADVFGVFGGAFCDFGNSFEVVDPTGEEPKSVFISNISKANPGVVTSLDSSMHGFETDDIVTFKEVTGMDTVNGQQYKIKVVSPYTFSFCDTSGDQFQPYLNGGIATQVKTGKTVSFKSLSDQLKAPEILIPDYSKFEVPLTVHVGFMALHKFKQNNGRLPNVWCSSDADQFLGLVQDIQSQGDAPQSDSLSKDVLQLLSYTCQGNFVPLCASLGGIVAQEALKAITGKFTPLNQWLYLEALDVVPPGNPQPQLFQPRCDRYDALRICVGDTCLQKLQRLKLFMIGCGAIGCEMMKNYAMMGISSLPPGKITITDNDLIEKSNLNRQFLFRPQHIRQPKSTTAASVVLQINSGLNIEPQQQKVCPQTEESHYPDHFFEMQDIIVNALDNVEARRYVDSRCVTAQRSLLESGTMGTKGHTQVIVAHVTESYGSQRDPQDEEVPYCTLKSFPANIENCIQWARDKFASSFDQKPNLFNKFWSTNSDTQAVIQRLQSGESIDGAIQTCKVLKQRPSSWQQCVTIGRLKFEKYFNHKAKRLLNVFPLDTKLSDGSPFWQSPKRPPMPIEFDPSNPLHLQFVIATAHLYADISKVPLPAPIDEGEVKKILTAVTVPPFIPSNKPIEVDESAPDNSESTEVSSDELENAGRDIQLALSARDQSEMLKPMIPADFEKDDDTNGHIDFIAAAANLRATMYKIETADRLKIKRIAGRIVPAIATTTAAVSGLISTELVKVVEGLPLEKYRNCFLNLGLPVIVLSEPGPAEKTVVREGMSFTIWDRWVVQGSPDFTLQQLLDHFKTKYNLTVTMVGLGVKMIYVPFMPMHAKRLPQTMVKLLKAGKDVKYVDLVVLLQSMEEEEISGPPVRYFLNLPA